MRCSKKKGFFFVCFFGPSKNFNVTIMIYQSDKSNYLQYLLALRDRSATSVMSG